jgi:hypothetical protein
MSEKKLLIVVPDDHYHKKQNYTFLVYDFESGKLLHRSPYNEDLDCKELQGQRRPTFRPYGITCDDDYLYIASHKKLAKYNKKTFEYCGLVDIPMYVNTHRMLKSGEEFYVTHTSVNVIGVHGKTDTFFDAETLQCVNKPPHPEHAEEKDTVHVNSLTEHNGKIYFCLHNLDRKPSQFGYFDKSTYESEIFASVGGCCHDVRIINNTLYSLSSITGEIIEIDLTTFDTKKYKVVKRLRTFLRGMDVIGDKLIFVGSNHYSDGVIEMNNCFVANFDTKTKQTKRISNINHADIVNCIKIIQQ